MYLYEAISQLMSYKAALQENQAQFIYRQIRFHWFSLES